MCGIEQVKRAAAEREQRKGANAARALGIGAREKILKGQSEEQAQAEEESHAGQ
jgi:hypothetical protein